MTTQEKKKTWTDEERINLATRLQADLDKHINSLKKRDICADDDWQKEMDRHPLFMTNSPGPDDELSPLMQGLQQLRYGEDENTPEELASNYKDEGNFNYKQKNYRLAIISYTEGIKTNCKNQELMAQLYNNRAAAQFMLENYRSSLTDCKLALKLKQKYPKALHRAAVSSFRIKDYNQCIEFCDKLLDQASVNEEILELRTDALIARGSVERDKRKQEKEDKKLWKAILDRGIAVMPKNDPNGIPELSDLKFDPEDASQEMVKFNKYGRLLWPVIFKFSEQGTWDLVEQFDEDTRLIDQLEEIFKAPHELDVRNKYNINNINVYFKSKQQSFVAVDIRLTLGEILQDKRFIVCAGALSFYVVMKSSQEDEWLRNFNLSVNL